MGETGTQAAAQAPIRSLSVDGCPGGRRLFRYPAAGNMDAHIQAILSGKEYRLPKLEGYRPDLIIDIGANVGASTVYFAAVFPDVPIVSIEPAPENLVWLARNTADLAQVTRLGFGLGVRDGRLRLYRGASQPMQNSLHPSIETAADFDEVVIRRARDALGGPGALADARSALLKLDCEGGEVAILEDLAPLLDRVDLVLVEYHAEADRLALDRRLQEHFQLYAARADWPHRGRNHYVARRLSRRFPALDALRIDSADRAGLQP